MPDASPAASRFAATSRVTKTIVHLGLTHYRTPSLLKRNISLARDQVTLEAARGSDTEILRMEALPGDWDRVERRLDRSIDLPWLVRTGDEEDWREPYTDSLYARVRELYRPDFELFGYDQPT